MLSSPGPPNLTMRADSPSLTVQGLRYTLSPRILGSGGFATVHQAVAPSGALVAVKIVDRSRHAESVLSQLQNERQALALAQTHPCIVKFYGAARQVRLPASIASPPSLSSCFASRRVRWRCL